MIELARAAGECANAGPSVHLASLSRRSEQSRGLPYVSTSIGPAPDDDWFNAPPDAIPDDADWMNHGLTAFAHWLADEAAKT